MKYDKIIDWLCEKAFDKGYTVILDETSNIELWHHSKVLHDRTRIFIYWHDDIHKLAVLAHEIGHIYAHQPKGYGMTPQSTIQCEYNASKWAYSTLKRKVRDKKVLKKCRDLYNDRLKNYKEDTCYYGTEKI